MNLGSFNPIRCKVLVNFCNLCHCSTLCHREGLHRSDKEYSQGMRLMRIMHIMKIMCVMHPYEQHHQDMHNYGEMQHHTRMARLIMQAVFAKKLRLVGTCMVSTYAATRLCPDTRLPSSGMRAGFRAGNIGDCLGTVKRSPLPPSTDRRCRLEGLITVCGAPDNCKYQHPV